MFAVILIGAVKGFLLVLGLVAAAAIVSYVFRNQEQTYVQEAEGKAQAEVKKFEEKL